MSDILSLKIRNGAGELKTLEFLLRPTPIAQRWAACLERANRQSHIREDQRFYNFPEQSGNLIIEEIEKNIFAINQIFPALIPYHVDRSEPQESVNRIHHFFADTELDKKYVTDQSEILWNDLNNALHGYESLLRSQETQKLAGIPEANLVVTFQNDFREFLKDEDYEHFTVAKKFGTCYVNYCQIGRHLYEMFLADDDIASDEHISPLRHVSADTYIWLGSTTGPQAYKKRLQSLEDWFERHKTRLNGLGFHWGDARLALGWIPVADLRPEILALPEQLDLLNQLRNPQRVESWNQSKESLRHP